MKKFVIIVLSLFLTSATFASTSAIKKGHPVFDFAEKCLSGDGYVEFEIGYVCTTLNEVTDLAGAVSTWHLSKKTYLDNENKFAATVMIGHFTENPTSQVMVIYILEGYIEYIFTKEI